MPLDKADSKVKEICDLLRKETLEPAQLEAKRIIEEARKEADVLIQRAKEEVLRIREGSKKELARELQIYEGSIQLAISQGLSALRQSIEKLFSKELELEVARVMGKEDVIAKTLEVILGLIQKEGLGANLTLLLPKHVNVEAICNQLVAEFSERVKKGAIQVGDVKGGAEIKLKDKKLSIDMTDQAVRELLASYVIPELREKVFVKGNE